jgi:DNA-binding Lrp family transcriptional regulator
MQKMEQSFDLNNQVFLELSLSQSEKRECHVAEAPQRALLLINIAPAESLKAIADIKKIKGVSEVYAIKGMYDVLAAAQAESFDELKIVLKKIKRTAGIKTTLTLALIGDQASARPSTA